MHKAMSEDSYIIARVIFLMCVLVLVVPSVLGRGITLPIMARNIAIWIGLAAGVAMIYEFWKG
jgi:hypothetical protein